VQWIILEVCMTHDDGDGDGDGDASHDNDGIHAYIIYYM